MLSLDNLVLHPTPRRLEDWFRTAGRPRELLRRDGGRRANAQCGIDQKEATKCAFSKQSRVDQLGRSDAMLIRMSPCQDVTGWSRARANSLNQ